MTQSQHTQGPWVYKPCPKGALVRPYERFNIFSVSPDCFDNSYGVNTGGKLHHLATIRAQASKTKTEANANLIAAAPDMLEALEDLLRDIPIKQRPTEAFKKAINATRKAKGEM